MDKIRRIFPLLILFTLLSCADTIETRIPYRVVYLELDLTYQDKALNAIQAYKIYTSKDVDQAGEQTGFGGVLVYHGLSSNGTGAFFAFDAACPLHSAHCIRQTANVHRNRGNKWQSESTMSSAYCSLLVVVWFNP